MYRQLMIVLAFLVLVTPAKILFAEEPTETTSVKCTITSEDGKTETKEVSSKEECEKLGGTLEVEEKN